jgi:hypothetical protein
MHSVIPNDVDEAEREEQRRRNQAAIDLLRSWREDGDEEEQRQTWALLKLALENNPIQIERQS